MTTSNLKLYPAQAAAARDHALSIARKAGLQVLPGETLRFVPDSRIVLRATLEDRQIVLRAPLSDAWLKPMTKEWAELERVHAYMSQGANKVVEPIHFDAKTGLTVIAYVPGTPMMTHLRRLPKDMRAQTYVRTAGWLQTYLAPTLTTQPVNAKRWLSKAKEAVAKQPHEKLREVELRVFRKMRHLSKQIDNTPWPVAITHSDFHPNNLIVDESTLTGIDCGGSGTAPVAKDLARSLTHMARRGLMFGKDRKFGMDAQAYEALRAGMDLPPEMWTQHLPFMLCFETLFRVEHPQMPANRVDHAYDMTRGLLRDLRKIT